MGGGMSMGGGGMSGGMGGGMCGGMSMGGGMGMGISHQAGGGASGGIVGCGGAVSTQGQAAWPDDDDPSDDVRHARLSEEGADAAKRARATGGPVYGSGEHGRNGRTISVVTNFYRINVSGQLRVAQYDVTFSEPDVLKAETRRRILGETPIHLICPSAQQSPPAGCTGTAYDGNKTLLAANAELALTPQATAAGWSQLDSDPAVFQFRAPPAAGGEGGGGGGSRGDGGRRYGGTLTIKRTAAPFVAFDRFQFDRAAGGDPMRAQMMILDIVFKAQASSRCKMLGDAFYDETRERAERPWAERHRISQGLNEIWLGYRTATVFTENGPMLQVDRAASCMLAPIRLEDFIAQKLRMQRLALTSRGEDARLSGVPIHAINRKLTEGERTLKASSCHKMSADGRRHLMQYVVRGLDNCPCGEVRFQEVCGECAKCADVNAGMISKKAAIEEKCEQPRWISLVDWFRREFPNFPIHRPDLPCVLAGNKTEPGRIKIPLEFLSILPGQPVQETGSEVRSQKRRMNLYLTSPVCPVPPLLLCPSPTMPPFIDMRGRCSRR